MIPGQALSEREIGRAVGPAMCLEKSLLVVVGFFCVPSTGVFVRRAFVRSLFWEATILFEDNGMTPLIAVCITLSAV